MWTMGITQWCLPGGGSYTLQLAKQLGFDAVQLEFAGPETGMPLARKRLQELYRSDSRALGIHLLPLTVNALCRYGVVDGLNTPDGRIACDTIKAALETAAAMELEGITLPSFGAGEIKTQANYAHTVEALRFACEHAAPLELTVYTENVLDPRAMEQLFCDCASDRLRLLFDSQNYSVFGHNYARAVLEAHWDRLGSHLHVKDGGGMGTMLLGSGVSPFEQVMEILRQRGYNGAIVLENNYGSLPLCGQATDCFSLVQTDMETVRRAMK